MSSDWTSYLKKAVATAETRFDQLLEETASGSVSSTPQNVRSTPSPRMSMQERLRGAVSGSPRSSGEFDSEKDPEKDSEKDSLKDSEKTSEKEKEVISESETQLVEGSNVELEKLQQQNTELAEQLDALQNKVSILSGLEAERTKSAPPHTKKLAERDKQIALLIEEGTILSKKELTYMNSIKKLRAKLKQSETLQEGFDKVKVKNEKQLALIVEKLASKESELAKIKEEMKILKRDGGSSSEKPATVVDNPKLKEELENLKEDMADLKKTNQKWQSELVEKKTTIEDLQSKLKEAQESNTLLKNNLNASSLSSQTVISDLKQEIGRLEARVEHYRGLNEESVARNSDENTAKLLNQIENLNLEHSHSQQNWRSVELSLQGKISKLEQEMEESKSREAALIKKNKSLQAEIRTEQDEIANLQDELSSINDELFKTQRHVQSLKDDIKLLLDKEKDKENKEKEDKEIVLNKEESDTDTISQLQSRIVQLEDQLQTQSLMSTGVPSPMDMEPETPFAGVPASPSDTFDRRSERFGSMGSLERLADVDQFTELDSRRSGTGPSIQMIGRMGSQVRKLTSEVCNLKEELARVANERDDASREVVRLMGENDDLVKSKKALDQVSQRLENMEQRESQALEMLGEKEEKISELRADIADMKELYSRQISDLVDQLMDAKK